MSARAYCDCHVNIWNDEHILPLYQQQLSRVRPGEMALKADADTLHAEMAAVEKATRSGCGSTSAGPSPILTAGCRASSAHERKEGPRGGGSDLLFAFMCRIEGLPTCNARTFHEHR